MSECINRSLDGVEISREIIESVLNDMGIEYEFNSSTPGFIGNDGKIKPWSEMESVEDYFNNLVIDDV